MQKHNKIIMKKSYTILAMLFLTLFLQNMLLSQVTLKLNNISVSGQVNTAQLCNVIITKTGTDSNFYNYYLEGSITHNKDGKVVTGQSGNFQLPFGTTVFTPANLNGCNYNIMNDKYKNLGINPPPGDYKICVVLKIRQPAISVAEDCITVKIDEQKEITKECVVSLSSPVDGSTVDIKSLTFVWSPAMPPPKGKVSYILSVYEFKKGLSKEEALRKTAILQQKDLVNTTFSYKESSKLLVTGKSYVWKVDAVQEGKVICSGGPLSFLLDPSCSDIGIDSLYIACDDDSNRVYDYRILIRNNCPGPNQPVDIKGLFIAAFGAGIATVALPPPPPPTLPGVILTVEPALSITLAAGATQWITGTFNAISMAGDQFEFFVWSQNPGYAKAYDFRDTTLPPCSCCEDFIKIVNNLNVTSVSGSNTNYMLSGNIQAGPNDICKIQAEWVYFSWKSKGINGNSDAVCRHCVKPSDYYGNFAPTPSPISSLLPVLTSNPLDPGYAYSREIIWSGATLVNISDGTPVHIPLSLPPANSLQGCCVDSIKMCIRFSFTDITCTTCDTLVTVKFARKPDVIMGLNQNYRENLLEHLYEAGANVNDEIKSDKLTSPKTNNLEINNTYINKNQNLSNVSKPIPGPGDWWFFGTYAGLHFTSSGVTAVTGNLDTWEGSSVLSENSGNLRFYTDGRNLYNSTVNTDPPIYTGMNGNSSTSQCGIILPFDNLRFGVVTPDWISRGADKTTPYYTGDNTHNGLTFYLFEDDGSYLSTTSLIQTPPATGHENQTTEKITAILNSVGDGYWLIGHGHDQNISSNYYSYPISKSNGSIGAEVISTTSLDYFDKGGGYMRASPNCDILAVNCGSKIEILTINRASGQLTQTMILDLTVIPTAGTTEGLAYGVEFSPSGRYLYVTRSWVNNAIIRFDLQAGTTSDIQNSGTIVTSSTATLKYVYGALSLGPDGNIYVARDKESFVSRIENPDSPTPPTSIVDIPLADTTYSGLGLPNFSQCVLVPPPPSPDTCKLCVRKWVDKAPYDGVYNTGEGISGQTFVFTPPLGSGSPFTGITDANGEIHIHNMNLTCGISYTVTETPILTGYTPVDPPSGSIDIPTTINCEINYHQFQNSLTTGSGSCDTCCTAFNNFWNMTPPVLTAFPGTNNAIYLFQTNITAGPSNFTEIRASMVNFHHINSNPDCDTCIKQPIFFGSILPWAAPMPWPLPSGGTVSANPGFTCFSADPIWDQNPREIVWRKNGDARLPLNPSVPFTMIFVFPPLLKNSCCCDTIAYCIRFTFEDAPPSCQACSYLYCDTIIRCYNSSTPQPYLEPQMENELKKELKKLYPNEFKDIKEDNNKKPQGKNENYEQNQKINTQGQSAGIISVNIDKRSNIKLKVFDLQGKEIMKIYDDYVNEGKYSFDLNHYNLAEGIYYYKLENDGKIDYQKVAITKQSGCNCGKK